MVIICLGDLVNMFYYVIEGLLVVCIEDEQGCELIFVYISCGQFIGEMGLFVEQVQCELMVCMCILCEMVEISYEWLFQLMEGQLCEECLKILFVIGVQFINCLLCILWQVSCMVFMDVINCILCILLDLCQELDVMIYLDGIQICILCQEVSCIVGCLCEMVGCVFKQFEEQGMIQVFGKIIVVFGIC